MSDVVYRSKEYIIIKKKRCSHAGFIVINTKKDFNEGHTHVDNYNTAKLLINLSKNKQIPKSKNKHFVSSLIRISKDRDYIDNLNNIK